MKNIRAAYLTSVLLIAVIPFSLQAQTSTWNGGDGEYTTGTNWSPTGVPNTGGGATALITAGNVNYTPGGDLTVQNGGTLQVSGGSFTQTGGIAWMNFQGGNLIVDGGTFNQGTAGNFLRNASSSISVSDGELSLIGNLIYDSVNTGTLALSGTGIINVDGEFKPVEAFSMTGGTLNVSNLISFADGPGGISFSGGTISVDGAGGNSGFYGGSIAKSLDFSIGSVGKLIFRDYTLAELGTDNFLNNGTITFNGAVSGSDFVTSQVGLNVEINVIPEPSTIIMTLTGMGLLLAAARRRK